jgi:hypothetical protein
MSSCAFRRAWDFLFSRNYAFIKIDHESAANHPLLSTVKAFLCHPTRVALISLSTPMPQGARDQDLVLPIAIEIADQADSVVG